MGWLANWSEKRRERKAKERYRAGWDWAAGRLLEGESPDDIEAQAQNGIDFDGPNPFDKGVIDAVTKHTLR